MDDPFVGVVSNLFSLLLWGFILLVAGGAVLRLLMPILMVTAAVREYKRSVAAQRVLLQAGALQSPAGQERFVQGVRQSAEALARVPQHQQSAQISVLEQLLHQASQQQPGRWNNGAFFEGGNVVIPGGPSMINGRLYVPGIRV